ncbi:MAG: amidohydrolase family protein, partial [Anaerolineales bacterium]|nr:amidohydrolase family protein [Anaerolineales bacterium]
TCSQEVRQGSLTPGKLADITIYDRNIFEVSHDELKETKIAGTIVGGKVRYRTW